MTVQTQSPRHNASHVCSLFAARERCYDERSSTPPRRPAMTKLLDRTRYAALGMPPVALASPAAGGSERSLWAVAFALGDATSHREPHPGRIANPAFAIAA
jgi:hypothetical protein